MEARIASNADLVERMNKMNISFVAVDFTQKADSEFEEFRRTGSLCIPVNLIYPPNYPLEPAIKLEPTLTPTDIRLVLDRMEAITAKLKE